MQLLYIACIFQMIHAIVCVCDDHTHHIHRKAFSISHIKHLTYSHVDICLLNSYIPEIQMSCPGGTGSDTQNPSQGKRSSLVGCAVGRRLQYFL